jgi:hypothetical protein
MTPRPKTGQLLGVRGLRLILQALGDVQFDGAVTRFEVLDRGSQVDGKALGGVVRHNDAVIIQNLAEKVRIHPEINENLVRSLRNAANVRVRGAEGGGVDRRGSLFCFAHRSFEKGAG